MIALRKTRLGAELIHKCVAIDVQIEKKFGPGDFKFKGIHWISVFVDSTLVGADELFSTFSELASNMTMSSTRAPGLTVATNAISPSIVD